MGNNRNRRSRKASLKLSAPAPVDTRFTDQGTAQTRNKLRTDVALKMFDAGKLERIHVVAVEEIRLVYGALQKSFVANADYSRVIVDNMGRNRDLLDMMSEKEERLFRVKYNPWAKALAAGPLQYNYRGRPMQIDRAQAIVHDVVVDNWGTKQTDIAHKFRDGTAAAITRTALELYCELAGMVERRKSA